MTCRINLALQGGGAHGAFTWGALDRLLDEDAFEIAGISGTSAGALNAAALKAGLVTGGRDGARAALDALWTAVGSAGDFRFAPWMRPFWPYAADLSEIAENLFPISPAGIAAQLVSPYDWNGLWSNPLAHVVASLDFDAIAARHGPKIFIGATDVRTGKPEIFSGRRVTSEAILASACLPTAFRAVEIDGRAFWGGGFSGNPALFPLYEADLPDDILIIQVNPLRREAVPTSPVDIQNRITEISFNAPLLAEMRAIRFVRRLIASGALQRGTMKEIRLHLISDDKLMNDLSGTTKMLPSPALLGRLRQAGRAAADRFLDRHGKKLGEAQSLDIAEVLD